MKEVRPLELKELLSQCGKEGAKVRLLDVRESEEHELVKLEESLLIPLMEVEARIEEVKTLAASCEHVVVYCRSGVRSEMVCQFLRSRGIQNVANLLGGINAYAKEADTTLTPY